MVVIRSKRSLAAPVTLLLLVIVAVSASLILIYTVTSLGEAKESEEGPTNALVIEEIVDGKLIVRNIGWRQAQVSALYVLEPVEKRILAAFRYDPPLPIAPQETREIPIPSDIRNAADKGEMVLYVIRSTQAAAEARLGPFLPQASSGGSSGSVLGLPSSIGTVLWLSGTSGSTLVAFTYNDTSGAFHSLLARGDSGALTLIDWSSWAPSDLFNAYQSPTIPVWEATGDLIVLGTTPPNSSQKAATLVSFLDPQTLSLKKSIQVMKTTPSTSTNGTTIVELGGPPGLPETASPVAAFFDPTSNTLYWLGVTNITRTSASGTSSATHMANYVARLDLNTMNVAYTVFWAPIIIIIPNGPSIPYGMPLLIPSSTTTTFYHGFHDSGIAVVGGKVYAMGLYFNTTKQSSPLSPIIAVFDPLLSRVEKVIVFNSTLLDAYEYKSLYFLKATSSQLVLAGDGFVSWVSDPNAPSTGGGSSIGQHIAYKAWAPTLIALDPVTISVTYASIFNDDTQEYTTAGLATSGSLAIQLLAPARSHTVPRYDVLIAIHDLQQKRILAVNNITIMHNNVPLPTVYEDTGSGRLIEAIAPMHINVRDGTIILTIAGIGTNQSPPRPTDILQLQVPLSKFLSLQPGDSIILEGGSNITLTVNPNTAALNNTAAKQYYIASNLFTVFNDPENSNGPTIVERTIDNSASVTTYTPTLSDQVILTLLESREK